MGQRQQLHDILLTILTNVYFQPPQGMTMEYPCIVYHRDNADTEFADDLPYAITRRYQVTLISRNPDEVAWQSVARLRACLHNRWFSANNLNHDVFNLFF